MNRLPSQQELREAELDGQTHAYNVAQGLVEEWQCPYDPEIDPECHRVFWKAYDRTLHRGSHADSPGDPEISRGWPVVVFEVLFYVLLITGFATAIWITGGKR